jgi:hypothetical protein
VVPCGFAGGALGGVSGVAARALGFGQRAAVAGRVGIVAQLQAHERFGGARHGHGPGKRLQGLRGWQHGAVYGDAGNALIAHHAASPVRRFQRAVLLAVAQSMRVCQSVDGFGPAAQLGWIDTAQPGQCTAAPRICGAVPQNGQGLRVVMIATRVALRSCQSRSVLPPKDEQLSRDWPAASE